MFYPVSDGNRCRDLLPSFGQSLVNSAEEKEEGLIVQARGFKDVTREPTETTNLGSQKITDSEPIAKDPTWNQSRPSTYE